MDSLNSEKLLETVLTKIQRPGEFCCGGVFPGYLPGIVVKDFGMLGLPLAKDKAEALARVCPREKIQEEPTNNIRRLENSQFSFCNPEWHSAVEKQVHTKIKSELGFPRVGAVKVQLNGFYLCEKGGSQLPLLDAAKDARTFARLVILLPSIYSGGELVVAYKDRKQTFDYSFESAFKNHYVAFYANCPLQLKAVTSGNYLVLMYNLILADWTRPLPTPADTYEIIPDVTEILHQWQTHDLEDVLKRKTLIIVLNLVCNRNALSWDNLRGRDHATSYVVKSAARKLPIDVYLCFISCTRYFGIDADEFHEFNEGKRYCDSSIDSKNTDAGSSMSGESKSSLNNCYDDDNELDSECYVSHFINVNGELCNLNNVHPYPSDIIPSNAFNGKQPYKEDVLTTEGMGASKVKYYRQAALLLLPRKDFSQIIKEGSISEVIDLALKCAENLKKKKSEEMWQKCHTAATTVISRIEALSHGEGIMSEALLDSQGCLKMIRALQLMNNSILFQWFISKVVIPQINCFSMEVFFHLATAKFGLDVLSPVFQSLIKSGQTPILMTLLTELCVKNVGSINVPEELTRMLASNLLARLMCFEDKNQEDARKFRSLQDLYRDTIVAVSNLFCTYSTLDDEDWLQEAINYVLRTPMRHPVEIVVTSAIENWNKWLTDQTKKSLCNAVKYHFAIKCQIRLLEDCIKQLMLVGKPEIATDSDETVAATCKCSDCKTVRDFTNNTVQNVLSMLVTQSTFDHLKEYQQLQVFELSLKKTEVEAFLDGAFMTLTLTKRNSDRLMETYNKCQAAIISLTDLLPENHPLKLQPIMDADEAPPKKKAKII